MRRSSILPMITACLFALLSASQGYAQTWSGWLSYGGNPQHTAISTASGQNLRAIRWSTPVDLQPQYSGSNLYIHYGSPLITKSGNVIVPVKTGASDGFRVEAHNALNGAVIWSQDSNYSLPAHSWTPSYGCCLTSDGRLAMPSAGGTVTFRSTPDSATGAFTTVAFYGTALYNADSATYNANVRITTPITSDKSGNVYFGFQVLAATSANLVSGIARISSTGIGTWASAGQASGDPNMAKVVFNCAPALSNDGKTLYFAVNNSNGSSFGIGYLVSVKSATLAHIGATVLYDVKATTTAAYLPDDGTATPTVGPDGDVYFGVLENPFGSNHYRGWLLHYTGDLKTQKPSGAFGWDDSASIVPASAVPSYTGTSTYLLLTKYNNYVEGGGDGVNKVAILDPNATMTDSVSGATVMKEILVRAGPTPDTNFLANHPDAVREWCINTAAVDVANRCAYVNNEDGVLYRWDFTTNTLTQSVVLTGGVGEAYTPTIMGRDGTAYAINNATLFAVGIYQTKLTINTASVLMGTSIVFDTSLTRNSDSGKVFGKNLTFTLDGAAIGTANTGTSGAAQLTYNLPSGFVAGNHILSVAFAGDADFAASTTKRTIPVRYQTAMALPSVTGMRGTNVNLVGTLTRTLDGGGLQGKTVIFKASGITLGTATTNASGVATYVYAIPATALKGRVTISAVFSADAMATSVSASAKLTIQ